MRADVTSDAPARPRLRPGVLATARARIVAASTALVDSRDADALVARFDRRAADVGEALTALYGAHHDLDEVLADLVDVVVAAAAARSAPLRRLDHAARSTPGGSSRSGRSATSATPTASPGTSPGSPDGSTTSPSWASRTST